MARARTAEGDEAVGTDGTASPLGWWERGHMRRRGRAAGRRRRPRVLTERAPLTTAGRKEIFAQRDLAIAGLWETFANSRAGIDEKIDARQREIKVLEEVQSVVGARLNDPTDTELNHQRAGEEQTPEAIRRQRRQREHARAQAPDLARLRDAEAMIERLRREIAKLQAERQSEYDRANAAAWTQHQLAVARRAVYDDALLARHPDGDLVAPVLDLVAPAVPAWMTPEPPGGGRDSADEDGGHR